MADMGTFDAAAWRFITGVGTERGAFLGFFDDRSHLCCAVSAPLPGFLTAQVDRFYRKRFFDHPRKPGQPYWYSLQAPVSTHIDLQSNDYLCLTGHPVIRDTAITALTQARTEAVMSQVYAVAQRDGGQQRHFEKRLGQFIGLGSGVLFPSGFDANVGLLQAVARRGLPVYVDHKAHASLYQGIQVAEAAVVRVRHNDLTDLRDKLAAGGPGVVVVDSVYSDSGSRCPLPEVVDLAEAFGCLLVVDESHSLGTHGPQGRGLVHELGLTRRVHVITASLAKAFASRAGFVACDEGLTEYLRFTAFPSIFSTALLAHELAPLEATLDVVSRADERRAALWHNAARLRAEVVAAGYDISNGSEQIIGIRCGQVRSAVRLRDALEADGVFASLFWYPATEWRQSVLRLSVNAGLAPAQIDRVGAALRAARYTLDADAPAVTAEGGAGARSVD